MFTTILLLNGLSLVGLLALSRRDSVLVDDEGRTLDRGGNWEERLVRRAETAVPTRI